MKQRWYWGGQSYSPPQRVDVYGHGLTLDGKRGVEIVLPYRHTRMVHVVHPRFVARTRGGVRRRLKRVQWADVVAGRWVDPKFLSPVRKHFGRALVKVVSW